ncbi:LppX_LprAFG lipoprotein [Nocardioides mangrovi]|uniref:LppX_LprAFG lipoprotein n=1 Tax=Nocardioides mangrovi TaxID=2874580 RepID=A0ABS7UKN7_9ACTN|nr:LppX_LprAFG lipoprotein [Nocardioides mangrovi]MBZ5741193.1 LppX_LprAFG lipoprotein [Nocardioides mangrovi]
MRLPRRLTSGLTAALLAASLTACGGGSDGGGGGSDQTPEEALAAAKTTLDDTSGVTLGLTTDDLPDGVTGVEKAEGVGTHAPAFDGTITVVLTGQAFQVPVVAVDKKVYVQLPLTTGWQDIDPADYGAPDPARLMSSGQGFSSLLPATTDLEQGDSVRGGEDNKEVLTTYTGTVGSDVVKNVIPTATGDFDASYTISDDDQLRSATLTGVFYEDSDPMTYTVTFDDYGTDKNITAP